MRDAVPGPLGRHRVDFYGRSTPLVHVRGDETLRSDLAEVWSRLSYGDRRALLQWYRAENAIGDVRCLRVEAVEAIYPRDVLGSPVYDAAPVNALGMTFSESGRIDLRTDLVENAPAHVRQAVIAHEIGHQLHRARGHEDPHDPECVFEHETIAEWLEAWGYSEDAIDSWGRDTIEGWDGPTGDAAW